MNWIIYSLIAIAFMGLSDTIRKVISHMGDAYLVNLLFQFAAFCAAAVLYLSFSRQTEFSSKLTLWAFIGGSLISIFTMFSLKALAAGPGASTVIPVLRIGGVTFAVILGIFLLKEHFSIHKLIGVILSGAGIYLLFTSK